MQYNTLPGTNLKVSQICLGTMMFGGQTQESESFSIMEYAFTHGVNFFDTANVYHQGESERIVGKWVKDHRQDVILATKVCGQMGTDVNDFGLGRRNILSAVDASLKRLDTDYIDVYYMHKPDYQTDIEETLETMTGLVKAGKVRYIGVSNFAAWQIADMLRVCDKRNYIAPVITQNVYNLLTRGIETELVPFSRAHKIGIAVYNPIAGGLLAGKHKPGKPPENTRFAFNPKYYKRYWSDENFEAVEDFASIASESGMNILELSMKWCASQPGITSVISGVSRLDQITQNIAALEGDSLTGETLAACDQMWRLLSGNRYGYIK